MPQELELLTGAPVVDVAVDPDEEKVALEQAIDLVTERSRTVEAEGDFGGGALEKCGLDSGEPSRIQNGWLWNLTPSPGAAASSPLGEGLSHFRLFRRSKCGCIMWPL
jgi:hypothetical protein